MALRLGGILTEYIIHFLGAVDTVGLFGAMAGGTHYDILTPPPHSAR